MQRLLLWLVHDRNNVRYDRSESVPGLHRFAFERSYFFEQIWHLQSTATEYPTYFGDW